MHHHHSHRVEALLHPSLHGLSFKPRLMSCAWTWGAHEPLSKTELAGNIPLFIEVFKVWRHLWGSSYHQTSSSKSSFYPLWIQSLSASLMRRYMHKKSKKKKQKEQLRMKMQRIPRLLRMIRFGESFFLSFPSFGFILVHWGQCTILKFGVRKVCNCTYYLLLFLFFSLVSSLG